MTTNQDEMFTGEYKLPISVQYFPTMVEENYIYVDKTWYVYHLLRKGRIYFISRPRRFGKSLLISILEEIFNGNKELFKGYWIYNQQMEWKKYPVIHLDFLGIDYRTLGLEKAIMKKLDYIAQQYEVDCEGESCKEKFGNLIQNLRLKKNERVVVLVDEYDKPIIDYVESENMDTAEDNRKNLKNFYSVLKSQDRNIKFLFTTGVSRFSRVSIFSDLNNLDDITLHPDYAKMFGYTGEEIETYFRSYIDKWIEKEGGTKKQLLERLKDEYNGYSWDGKNFLYNPHSIHKFFDELSLGSYWFETATPNFLVKVIMEKGLYFGNWENIEVKRSFFNEFNIEDININLLLFQTGYLTIKKLVDGQYTLAYPNKEVQAAFLHLLLGKYSHIRHERVEEITKKIKETLTEGNIDSFVAVLKTLFADIPYNIIKGKEAYYHSLVFIVLKMSNIAVLAEKETNIGRIDAVAETGKYIYIIEFKMGSADEAVAQILEKKYYEPFPGSGKEMILLGLGFSLEGKNISRFEAITFGPGEKINPVGLERSGVMAALNFPGTSRAMSPEINKRQEIQQDIESAIITGKYPVHGHFIEKIQGGYLFFLKNHGEFVDFCIDCNEIANKYGVFFQITADAGSFKIIENNGRVKKVLGLEMKLPPPMERYDDKNTLVISASFYDSLKEALTRQKVNTELLGTTTDNRNLYNLDFLGTVSKVGGRK
jgi:hypothetical protein